MEVSCPVSADRVNENVMRIIAFQVVLIAIACILFSNYWAMLFLLIDFFARAFTSGKWSFLKFVAVRAVKILSLPQRMTDLAPKKFAATLGFVFCLLIVAAYLSSFYNLVRILIIVLTGFALLESLFAICVGCYVYSFWQLVKGNK